GVTTGPRPGSPTRPGPDPPGVPGRSFPCHALRALWRKVGADDTAYPALVKSFSPPKPRPGWNFRRPGARLGGGRRSGGIGGPARGNGPGNRRKVVNGTGKLGVSPRVWPDH